MRKDLKASHASSPNVEYECLPCVLRQRSVIHVANAREARCCDTRCDIR
jgi:hypothetical protein